MCTITFTFQAFINSSVLIIQSIKCPLQNIRAISTTANCLRRRTGCYKVTNNRSRPLTYEMAQAPFRIGVTKSWNAWNTGNLL